LNDSDQPLAVGAAHPVDAAHPWTPLARELCFRDR
jgi:hypothetical protein